MNYSDFIIELGDPQADGSLPARVIEAPEGEGSSQNVALPFDLASLDETLMNMGFKLGSQKGEPENEPIRKMSSELFNALFSGPIGSAWKASLRSSRNKLRLKLCIQPGAGRINRIPWELAREANNPLPLSIMENCPMVRFISMKDTTSQPAGIPFPDELRVLVVVPNPIHEHLRPIDEKRVFNDVKKAWAGKAKVDLLKPATLEALESCLANGHYHILHVTTHGKFFEDGSGCVIFEHETNGYQLVEGDKLGAALQASQGSLRLVTLISCESGAMGNSTEPTVFGGVAPLLVTCGVPAVLAMQFRVSYDAAFAFSKTFYSRIVAGNHVDTAVSQARAHLYHQIEELEWATPLLFTSEPDGRLFANSAIHVNSILSDLVPTEDCEYVDLSAFFRGPCMGREVDPEDWNEKILPLLKRLPGFLPEKQDLCFVGKTRLSVWVALGLLFATTSGRKLSAEQFNLASSKNETWHNRFPWEPTKLQEKLIPAAMNGSEMVVVLSVSNPIEKEVEVYLQKHPDIHYRHTLVLKPENGPGQRCFKNNLEAMSGAYDMAEAMRREIKVHGISKTHLFLSGQQAFALFFGSRLNACNQIQIYHHLNPGYMPSFLLN